MSNGSEVMIYLSFLLSEFIATRRARLEAREAGFLVTYKTHLYAVFIHHQFPIHRCNLVDGLFAHVSDIFLVVA